MKCLKSILPVITAGLFAAGISIMFNSDVGRATFYKWSQTAASDDTADPTINWAEGMAPSAVNNSARAMMAALAKFRDDTSGSLVTAGTSTTYTLTTNQCFTGACGGSLALLDGKELAFKMNTTSGAAPTLNVDSLGAKAINQATGVAVPTGALISGAIYSATYFNATNEFIVKGIAGQIPSGTPMLVAQTACPTGWTKGATFDDRAIRLTTGTASTGGAIAFTTVFGRTATDNFQVLAANLPPHTHALSGTTSSSGAHSHTIQAGAAPASGAGPNGLVAHATSASNAESTDSGGAHTHTFSATTDGGPGSTAALSAPIDTRVNYLDVVLCTKN